MAQGIVLIPVSVDGAGVEAGGVRRDGREVSDAQEWSMRHGVQMR